MGRRLVADGAVLPWYDLRDAAVGDGVEDDRAAVQEVLDRAGSDGSSVFVPPMTFLLDPSGVAEGAALLDVPSGVTLFGAGTKSVFKVAAANLDVDRFGPVVGAMGVADFPRSGVVLRDFRIDGNVGEMSGTHGPSVGEGVNLKRCTDSRVEGLWVRDTVAEGVDLDYCDGVVVRSVHVRNAGGAGIHPSTGTVNTSVSSNTVVDSGIRLSRAGVDVVASATSVLVHGNVLSGCHINLRGPAACTYSGNVSSGGVHPDYLELT